jgi:hypothetical protein
VAAIRIRQLTSAEVCASADDFAQLLLDAHASGMALGLAPRLTPERATRGVACDRGPARSGRSGALMPGYAMRPDGAFVGNVFYYLEL